MKRLFLGFALTALVVAKPELYREKEDFQYARSSSDEGTKSGFYDAQRGNMGGNYERAHNMDTLAQHQMGGAIRQVEGELGDGAKMRSGSVYTAANSRGIFGSGHYDLSNLAGRNFQEGVSYGNSQSHSATSNFESQAHSSSQNSARYSSSHSENYGRAGYNADNTQAAQNQYNAGQYERGSHSGYNSKYNLQQSGYQEDYANLNHGSAHVYDANTHNSLVSTVPVKIIVRPGQRIAVPIATQNQDGSAVASYYDLNKANNDAELINTHTSNQQTDLKPLGEGKHYESSYRYHKQWEKHDVRPEVLPFAVPTVNSLRKNSELYDDYQLQQNNMNQYTQQAERNVASNVASHQADYSSQHHGTSAGFNSNAYSQDSRNSRANTHLANVVGEAGTKPQSYHSSYSYHKSWERQGDPYVIKPATSGVYDGQTSQKLTDGSQTSLREYDSSHTRSHQRYAMTNCLVECQPTGHIRVARSYGTEQSQFEQQSQDFGQQAQQQWNNYENMGQHTQNLDNLENLGQQTQNNLNDLQDFGQLTQDKNVQLEDLSQQSQTTWNQYNDTYQHGQNTFNKLEDLGQQTQNKWDNLQDFGQQTQDKSLNLEDLSQQSQTSWNQQGHTNQQDQNTLDKLEDLGQQTQNQWNNLQAFGQQTQNSLNLEDLSQQSQTSWNQQGHTNQQDQNTLDKLEDLGQQTQNQWNNLQAFGQQTQNSLNLEDLSQQSQTSWNQQGHTNQQDQNTLDKLEDLGQQTQNQWNNLQDFGQQTQNNLNLEDLSQQSQISWNQQGHTNQQDQNTLNKLEDLGQQTQNQWNNLQDFGQQTQNTNLKSEELSQQSQTTNNQHGQNKFDKLEDLGQQTQNKWDNLQDFGQQTQDKSLNLEDLMQKTENLDQSQKDDGQEIQNVWNQSENADNKKVDDLPNLGQQTQSKWDQTEAAGQQSQSGFEILDFGQQTQDKSLDLENFGQQSQFKWDASQQTQNKFDNMEDLGQKNLNNFENVEDLGQQTQNKWEFGQHTQDGQNLENLGQQTETEWTDQHLQRQQPLEIYTQTQKDHRPETQDIWDKLDKTVLSQSKDLEATEKTSEPLVPQDNNNFWDIIAPTSTIQNKTLSQNDSEQDSLSNLWGKIDNLDEDSFINQNKPDFGNNDFSQSSYSQAQHQTWYEEGPNQYSSSTSSFSNTNDGFDVLPITNEDTTEKKSESKHNFESTTEPGLQMHHKNLISLTTTDKTRYDDAFTSLDIDRGDIGPEDDLREINTPDKPNENDTEVINSDYNSLSTTKKPDEKDKSIVENPLEQLANHGHKEHNDNHNFNEELERQKPDWDTEHKDEQIFKNVDFQEHTINFDSPLDTDSEQKQEHDLTHREIVQINQQQQFEGWNLEQQNQDKHKIVNVEKVNEQKENTQWNLEQQNQEQFVDLNLAQQNQEQHFVDVGQVNENLQQQNINWDLVDFGQQNEKEYSGNMQNFNQENMQKVVIDFGQETVPLQFQKGDSEANSELIQASEVTTEKPGFWKSIGSKLKSTKNKIASWFGS